MFDDPVVQALMQQIEQLKAEAGALRIELMQITAEERGLFQESLRSQTELSAKQTCSLPSLRRLTEAAEKKVERASEISEDRERYLREARERSQRVDQAGQRARQNEERRAKLKSKEPQESRDENFKQLLLLREALVNHPPEDWGRTVIGTWSKLDRWHYCFLFEKVRFETRYFFDYTDTQRHREPWDEPCPPLDCIAKLSPDIREVFIRNSWFRDLYIVFDVMYDDNHTLRYIGSSDPARKKIDEEELRSGKFNSGNWSNSLHIPYLKPCLAFVEKEIAARRPKPIQQPPVELGVWHSRQQQAQETVSTMQEACAKSRVQLQEARAGLQRFSGQLAACEMEISGLQSAVEQAKGKLEAVRGRKSQLESRLDEVETVELPSLQQQLTQMMSDIIGSINPEDYLREAQAQDPATDPAFDLTASAQLSLDQPAFTAQDITEDDLDLLVGMMRDTAVADSGSSRSTTSSKKGSAASSARIQTATDSHRFFAASVAGTSEGAGQQSCSYQAPTAVSSGAPAPSVARLDDDDLDLIARCLGERT